LACVTAGLASFFIGIKEAKEEQKHHEVFAASKIKPKKVKT